MGNETLRTQDLSPKSILSRKIDFFQESPQYQLVQSKYRPDHSKKVSPDREKVCLGRSARSSSEDKNRYHFGGNTGLRISKQQSRERSIDPHQVRMSQSNHCTRLKEVESNRQTKIKFAIDKARKDLSPQPRKLSGQKKVSSLSKMQKRKKIVESDPDRKPSDLRMLKALGFFTDLKMLQRFEQKFNCEFPIIILNSKNQKVKNLRNEITMQGQHHQYFQNNDVSAKKAHSFYVLLERIERMVMRLFQTQKHKNVLKVIHQMDKTLILNFNQTNLQKVRAFLDELQHTNIELLDMLYHQAEYQSAQQLSTVPQSHVVNLQSVVSKSEERQQKHLRSKEHSYSDSYYEKVKKKGLEIYTRGKVCFYIMVDKLDYGFCDKFETKCKQLQPLNLPPNNPCLLSILLEKYHAFAQMLELQQIFIFIMVHGKKIDKIKGFISEIQQRLKRLNIVVVRVTEMPVSDLSGNMVLTSATKTSNQTSHIYQSSIGSGDLWDFLRDSQNTDYGLPFLKSNGFEYIEVIGAENCFQKCIDCFMMGATHALDLKWSTKSVSRAKNVNTIDPSQLKQSSYFQHSSDINKVDAFSDGMLLCRGTQTSVFNSFHRQNSQTCQLNRGQNQSYFNSGMNKSSQKDILNQDTFLYYSKDGNITTIRSSSHKTSEDAGIFINHSIFNVEYVCDKLSSDTWSRCVKYRKRVYRNEQKVDFISYEKDLSDMFQVPGVSPYSARSNQNLIGSALKNDLIKCGGDIDFQETGDSTRLNNWNQLCKHSFQATFKQNRRFQDETMAQIIHVPEFLVFQERYEQGWKPLRRLNLNSRNSYTKRPWNQQAQQNTGLDIQACSRILSDRFRGYLSEALEFIKQRQNGQGYAPLGSSSQQQQYSEVYSLIQSIEPSKTYIRALQEQNRDFVNSSTKFYISPQVSIEGEELQEVKKQLVKRILAKKVEALNSNTDHSKLLSKSFAHSDSVHHDQKRSDLTARQKLRCSKYTISKKDSLNSSIRSNQLPGNNDSHYHSSNRGAYHNPSSIRNQPKLTQSQVSMGQLSGIKETQKNEYPIRRQTIKYISIDVDGDQTLSQQTQTLSVKIDIEM